MPECVIGNVKIHIEVPLFLLFLSYTFAGSVTANFIMFRTCYVTLGYNKSDCERLGKGYTDNHTQELEQEVQPYATLIIATSSVVEAIFPPILCFFIGPWTDIYGRKPLILTSIIGIFLAHVTIVVLSASQYGSPWFLLLIFLPICLTGGVPALLTAMLSYITDVTSEENRGLRMGILEAVVLAGTLLGTLTSPFVLNACGYVTVYSICAGCVVLAWLYTFFFLPESIPNPEKEGRLRNLFKFSTGIDTVKTTFKRRENYDRALILIIMLLMIIHLLSTFGNSGVLFLYLRGQFNWSLQKYTMYSTIISVTGIIGSIIGAYLLHKLLHIREAIVILLGLLSPLLGILFQGLAHREWEIYVSGSIKCLGGAVSPMARSLLSKLVPQEDTSKVFSVLTALETMGALAGTSIFTYIYNSTLTLFPAAFNFVIAGTYMFELVLVGAMLLMQRYTEQATYCTLENDDSINECVED